MSKPKGGVERIWLWLFNMGAGYGLGTYNWRAVFWAVLLVYIGVAVAASSPQWATHCPGWWYAYSLDKLIPFLELDSSFKFGVLHGWRRAYFFFVHQAMGALILFFLVSGLAGMV